MTTARGWLRVTLAVSLAWGSIAAYGCGDSDDEPGKRENPSTETSTDDAGQRRVSECEGKPLGESCGDGRFCVREHCVWNSCGDGVKADDEQCDDGNSIVGDGCDPDCRAEPRGCGNAKVESSEECDDGNRIDVDGCSNKCTRNVCGNQRVDPGEECDDGNKVNDDHCSNECQSVRCRNGRVEPGEECDDGDQIDDNGCTNKCKIMICGNGKREQREECDDGNAVDNDACSKHCTANVCGNGRLDPGEECEHGTPGCDEACKQHPDKCRPCEEKYCRGYYLSGNYQATLQRGDDPGPDRGLDFGAACFYDMPGELWLTPAQPGEISKPCQAILDCARRTKCRTTSSTLGFRHTFGGVDPCYCGEVTSEEEQQACKSNPAGPCKDEYFAAAKTTDPLSAFISIQLTDVPAGFATYMLDCDGEMCAEECAPWIKDTPQTKFP